MTRAGAMRGIPTGERGIALILVLWVMALLTVIAGEFCHAVRTELNVTRNFKEETQAYYIALSGLFWAVQGLVDDDQGFRKAAAPGGAANPEEGLARINADIPAVPFGAGRFSVRKENESGKVNLNRAGEHLLKMMLNGLDIDGAEKAIIVDSILDWRDADSFHHVNGAEDDYYRSLPHPYRCKNGDFSSVDELLLVRGVTPQIFHGGLRDMVTVYQDEETAAGRDVRAEVRVNLNSININAASPPMLRALPRMTEEALRAILRYRITQDFRSPTDLLVVVGPEVYAGISPYLTFTLSPYYTIKAVGTLDGSRTRQGVQAVVRIDKTLERGYEVIQWIDSLEYGPSR